MRIAVVGGGTAGYLAAAHISRFFPDYDLYHIFDPQIAPLGVGEGTLPSFSVWLDFVTAAPFSSLAGACQATIKQGIRFEGWGTEDQHFHHSFAGDQHAYHLSANRLPAFLQPHIRATQLSRHVTHLHSTGRQVYVRFSDATHLSADFVIDATGFPQAFGHEQIQLYEIPTNAALVLRSPATSACEETRAVARPHGWIFIIPLTTSTSYGYVHNTRISQASEVRADFSHFLQQEGVAAPHQERLLRFPSFVRRQMFDGALLRIGNAASFLEPLEATAIAMTLEQLRLASLWLADGLPGAVAAEKWDPDLLRLFNRYLTRTTQAVALFVSWHYACGSAYNTRFWEFARTSFEEGLSRYRDTALLADFERYLGAAAAFPPHHLERIRDPQAYEQEIRPYLTLQGEIGGFGLTSFAQVGHGLGAYAEAATTA